MVAQGGQMNKWGATTRSPRRTRARQELVSDLVFVPELRESPAPEAWLSGIATLGPAGTSSEFAAVRLGQRLGLPCRPVALYQTYEEAGRAVLAGEAARLLVANAYHGISGFYMDPRLELELAFILDTPRYGIAARADYPIPLTSRVATHPAPQDLVKELLPSGYRVSKIMYACSTSAAAAQVAGSDAELALTTEPAASLHGLRFISATRPIRMLWSLFARQSHRKELS